MTEAGSRPAAGHRARRATGASWTIFGGLAAAIVVLDQLTKAWVVAAFPLGRPVEIAGDWLRITLVRNSGALFGLFRDQAVLFAVASVAVVAFIIWYQRQTAGSGRLPAIALGLLLGGAIGNLIDRFRLGYVVDFVDAGVGAFRWYTFNVADAAISFAILGLLLLALRPSGDGAGA